MDYKSEVMADNPHLLLPMDTLPLVDIGPEGRATKHSNVSIESLPEGGAALRLPKSGKRYAQVFTEFTQEFTAEAWIKAPPWAEGNRELLYAYNGSGNLFMVMNVKLNGTVSAGYGFYSAGYKGVNAPVNVLDDEWHHLVSTHQGGVVRLYVDGVEAGSVSGADAQGVWEGYMTIGSAANFNQEPSSDESRMFSGLIDNVAVYHTALPAERVAAHYNAMTPTSPFKGWGMPL